jgi:hypothetical protein
MNGVPEIYPHHKLLIGFILFNLLILKEESSI